MLTEIEHPSDLGINSLRGTENLPLNDPVAAVLNATARHEVDAPPEDRPKFVLHCDQVQEIPFHSFIESREQIDVAIRTQLIASRGAKNRQLTNPPLAAESLDL